MAFYCWGHPDSREFTPAELRLLLALGHQIGMAVENSYLIQQTSRRSEELHVLNEIGRALSSTLNKEDLLIESMGRDAAAVRRGEFLYHLAGSGQRRDDISTWR